MSRRTELQALRETLGFSQDTLAEHLEVRSYTVHRWEAGASTPSARYRRPLAEALQISPVELSRLLNTPSTGISGRDPSLTAINSLLGRSTSLHRNHYNVGYITNLAQLRELWAIDAVAYGDANLSYDRYEALWLANRTGLFAISVDDRVIGGFGIWPVPAEWMNSFRCGVTNEASLPLDTAEFSGSVPSQYWYISGIVLSPEYRSSYAASVLLFESTVSWVVQSELVYPVHLAAIAMSGDGEKLLARYGFELEVPAAQMSDGYSLYTRPLSRDDTIAVLKAGKIENNQQPVI